MRRLAKWTVLGGVAFGMVGVSSNWLTSVGYDFWRYSAYQEQLRAGEDLSETLDQRLENSEDRLQLKEIVVQDFLQRRTTFADVVDRFEQANVGNARVAQFIRAAYPTADDHEIAARNAARFISATLSNDLSTRGGILNLVRSEFDRQFPHASALSF